MNSYRKLVFSLMTLPLVLGQGLAQQEAIPQRQEADTCVLKSATSGDKVTLIGAIGQNPNGLLLTVGGCSSQIVVEYPSRLQKNEEAGISPLQEDDSLKNLESLLKAHPGTPVTASLFGRLDIAKPVPEGTRNVFGLLVDSSGKQVGTYGFGHPAPVYKYRLVLQRVYSTNSGS